VNVELKHIHKYFGDVHANNDVCLTIASGTIQGIVGENGAGKSTLMKVLSGFIQADEGEILLDGRKVAIRSPADASRYKIGMLHQDPLDFPSMRVMDNLLIGDGGGQIPNRKAVRQKFLELQQQFDFTINPDDYVDSLTVGERQQLEILRLLMQGARVLILDEPTTGISALQKEKLFAALQKLASQGMVIAFVSHKLEEIEALCQRVVVMRNGRVVGEAGQPYKVDDLVRLMFGKVITLGKPQHLMGSEEVLRVSDLEIESSRLRISNVNLTVHRGEVIGLAGMEGSGQVLFLRACGGLLRPIEKSKISLNGRDLTHQPYRKFLDAGVAYVPANRLEEGLVPGLTLADHFALVEESQPFLIAKDRVNDLTQRRIETFNIIGTPVSRVEELSGGNQQRALLALQGTALNLLLIEHPARGLDIESTIWIWSNLKERCKQGAAIIFISSDLEQILQYSDRIVVFFGGKTSAPLPAAEMDAEKLGQLIGGKGL
jgi:general nucleoside transport system ATP-binding protein